MAEWIKVEGADELTAGLTVEIRPCGFCGRTERFVLMRHVSTALPAALNGVGDFVASTGAWRTAPGLCHNQRLPFDPSAAIADGRLFRLAGDAPEVGEKASRTLELAGGGRRR
jgi:hypothetical protein